MQRQSLGSPGTKHHHVHGGGANADDDDDVDRKKRKSKGGVVESVLETDNDESKLEKPIRTSYATAANTERSIHLIPVLTLLCFLVLYLCSHDPSPKDLAGFGDSTRILDPGAAAGMGRYLGTEMSSIRSHRRLKELEKLRAAASGGGGGQHRKLGGGGRR